jgi:hypothetical protein
MVITERLPLLNPNGPCVFVRSKIECNYQPMENGVTFWCSFRHVYTLQKCKVDVVIHRKEGITGITSYIVNKAIF